MEKEKDMEKILIEMVTASQALGKIILLMEKEKILIKKVISFMMEITLMIKEKDLENIFMKMENIIQGNGKMITVMVKENYIIKIEN